jgi:serine/threonine-protein kinase HipA
MRKAEIYIDQARAGMLYEEDNRRYRFEYEPDYSGYPVSLTMPLAERVYYFDTFPPFFEGLLPEGPQLEGLLRQRKIDRSDFMGQLLAVGQDVVGYVTIKEVQE